MHRAGRRRVCKQSDGIRDPAPGCRAIVIAFGRELVGARGAFRVGAVAVALEHQGGGPPDVDFRYHRTETVSA